VPIREVQGERFSTRFSVYSRENEVFEIQCPRREQYWYANNKMTGRDRLCERCVDHVSRKRGGLMSIPYLIVAGVLL
jgi:hypothetical protein